MTGSVTDVYNMFVLHCGNVFMRISIWISLNTGFSSVRLEKTQECFRQVLTRLCSKYGLFAVHTAFKNMYSDSIHVCHSKFTVYV